MYQVDKIKSYLSEVESLALLAEVFTDLAKIRLDRIRATIERNRIYAAEIAKVLHIVRVTAEERGLSAARKKKLSASLLITSDKRLYYGFLDTKVVDFYLAHTAYAGYADRFVVGLVGMDILAGKKYPFAYERIVFAKDFPTGAELSDLTKKLAGYQKVIVYFPRLLSLLSQIPTVVDITGFLAGTVFANESRYYIFEPEIGKILNFFEEQIIRLLLEQSFLEAELARTGTELTTMDQARQNASRVISSQRMALALARKQFLNWQSLDLAAGIIQRNKGEV